MKPIAILISLALLLITAGCTTMRASTLNIGSGSGTEAAGSAAASPSASGPATADRSPATADRGPSPSAAANPRPAVLPDPRDRMLLGAYVNFTGQRSVAASVEQRERAMGRPYDLELTYYDWADPFPDAGEARMAAQGTIPLMAWYGPDKAPGSAHTLRDVISGADDGWITRQARAIRAFGHPVFLRLMPEMNGDWYGYSSDPAAYIAAWRHIHDVFARAGATNVTWVWCPNLSPYNWDSYYPGNGYVDVIGVDGFSNTRYAWQTFQQMYEGFFKHFAAFSGHKPLLVAETSTNSGDGSAAAGIGSAASYITGMAEYLRTVAGPRYGVIGVCWFDTNANDQYNWRVDQTQAAWRAWLAVARSPYFGGPAPGAAAAPLPGRQPGRAVKVHRKVRSCSQSGNSASTLAA